MLTPDQKVSDGWIARRLELLAGIEPRHAPNLARERAALLELQERRAADLTAAEIEILRGEVRHIDDLLRINPTLDGHRAVGEVLRKMLAAYGGGS